MKNEYMKEAVKEIKASDENICLWQLFVPTIRNDGRPIKTRFHRVWDKIVRDITGGLTICVPVVGQWIDKNDDDRLYKERMIPVQIACTKENIEKILKFTMTYYEQKAIFCFKVSGDVILYEEE